MLQQIRDNATGPVTYVIIGLISLVFGVWGIGSYFTQSANPVVASAGNTSITKYQLQQAYNQRYRRLHNLLGDKFDYDNFDANAFRHKVLQGLIQQALLAEYASDSGYQTTDQMLLAFLQVNPRFQVNGKFSNKRYKALLQQVGLTPARFEAQKRRDMQVQQARRALLSTAFVTSREVALAYKLQHQRRQLAYLQFDPADYADQVNVTEQQVKAYYHAHAEAFMSPERVKLAYIDLDRDTLVIDQPQEDQLRGLYAQQKDALFKIPARRKARQIFIQVDADTNSDAARKQVLELHQKLKQGAEFAALARKYSDDQATAAEGGQLGWVTKGAGDKAFNQALFALQKGAVSMPVRAKSGWYLIKLEGIQPAKYKPFDNPQVQKKLLTEYRQRQRNKRFRKLSDKLEGLSFEIPGSLKPIAQKLGLQVEHSSWIKRNGKYKQGLGQYAAVRKAAFSDAVIKDELNSVPIQLAEGRVMVLRVADHQAAKQKPLATVSDKITQQLRQRDAIKLARSKAEAAQQALREGKSLSQTAALTGASATQPQWLTRDSDGQPAGLLDAAFAMPTPQDEQPTYKIATLADNDVALLQLSAVKSVSPDNVDAKKRATLKRVARARVAALEYAALLQSLRGQYNVDIHEELIN